MNRKKNLKAPKNTGKKQANGRWEKGQSGNPDGRPIGSRNEATMVAQTLLEGEAEHLTRKAIKLAICGNAMLLKFFLERLLPPPPKNIEDDPMDLNIVIEKFQKALEEEKPPGFPNRSVIEVAPIE